MGLSKYNKLEKLGFTFWTKRQNDEIQLESYLIGGSALAICTSSNLDFNLIERERFITSMAYFLKNDAVKKVNIEEVVKTDIKTAFFFDCSPKKIIEAGYIKIFSLPSLKDICSSANTKKDFLVKLKEDPAS
ncbi:MAG: hypothetical protein EVA52_02220 [Gammaproteobacteria bacterium]|nr:MAG: hypothetical protein EVA52_02220 [Gammaproteobacteria bacterium]